MERFELSFRNKEVRMWLYIIIPIIIVGFILPFNETKFNIVRLLMLSLGMVSYYSWRIFYRRKQKEERN